MQIAFYAAGVGLLLSAPEAVTCVFFGSTAPVVLAMACSVALSVIVMIDYDYYGTLGAVSGPDDLCDQVQAGTLNPGRLVTQHMAVHFLPLFFAQMQCILHSRSLKVHRHTAVAVAAVAIYPNLVYSIFYDVTEVYGNFPPLTIFSISGLAAFASVVFCGSIND